MGNIGRKINITRENTFSLDPCYFFCAKNLLYPSMEEAVMPVAVSGSPLTYLWENVIKHIFLNTTKSFSEELPLKHVKNRCRLITVLIHYSVKASRILAS